MKIKLKVILLVSHLLFFGVGAGLGIYMLPIMIEHPNASLSEIDDVSKMAKYSGKFTSNQKGNDAFHWVEGDIYITDKEVAFKGGLTPGPDFRVYLTKKQAVDKDSFLAIKNEAVLVGDLRNFGNFRKAIPDGIDINEFTAVQIWCERFSQFIGSAEYRQRTDG